MADVDKRLRIRSRSGAEKDVYGAAGNASNPMAILHETNGVIFPYTPTVTYKQNPQWQSQDLTHSIQQYYYFTAVESAQISIGGRFTVQNSQEGKYLLGVWHFLRSYSKMHFGINDPQKGLPPPILLLDGYGGYVFNELPIIIQTWNIDFPADVDYVRVSTSTPIVGPEIRRDQSGTSSSTANIGSPASSSPGNEYAYLPSSTNINITAVVQRPPNSLKRDFNLQDFREGRLLKGFT